MGDTMTTALAVLRPTAVLDPFVVLDCPPPRARRRFALVTMCAWCRKVRDDRGGWSWETSFEDHTPEFTHGICTDCMVRELEELP